MGGDPNRADSEQSGSSTDGSLASSDEQTRRGFVARILAVTIGGIVGLFPVIVGAAFFFDPLRKRKPIKSKSGIEKDDEGFLKIVALKALLVGGLPRRYAVIDELSDAWSLYPAEPIGAVYLLRTKIDEVLALNSSCPHAGCEVGFDRDRSVYQCPCHDSSFKKTGELDNLKSPSPRGLDPLAVKITDDGQVWVKFQNFQSATSKRIVEE